MNARELIHALSAEWIDQDKPVLFAAFDSTGEFYAAVVTEVTSRIGCTGIDYEPFEEPST